MQPNSIDRWCWRLLIVFSVALGGLAAWMPRTLQRTDRALQQQLLLLQGTRPAPTDLLIVKIDDASFDQAAFFSEDPQAPAWARDLEGFPWPRAIYAQIIDRLFAAGAQAIAIDLLFVTPSTFGPVDDAALAERLQRYGDRISLATEYREPDGSGGLSLGELTETLGSNLRVGYINTLPADDGQILDHPARYRETVVAPLGLPVLPSLPETLQKERSPARALRYYGPQGHLAQISAWQVLDDAEWRRVQGQVRDRLILIGPTAASLQDQHATPWGIQSGVEILATALANDRDRSGLRFWPQSAPMRALLTSLFLVAIVLVSRSGRSLRWQIAPAIAAAGLWMVVAWLSLLAGWVLPLLLPLVGSLAIGVSTGAAAYLREGLERRRLRQTFERYVAPAVVAEILQSPLEAQQLLRGQRRTVTILFCDLRGFTALTRDRASLGDEETLISQLNEYLTAMVTEITQVGGTIDKFIGDAVMAVFGSPLSQGEEADAAAAIAAALGMRQALQTLNQRWQAEGRPVLDNGIGLHCGPVLAGNIGSPQRLEFTVMGDTVNLASRLESMTKELKAPIVISEALQQVLGDRLQTRSLGRSAIRGYGEVALYAVEGWAIAVPENPRVS
ncbi:adenylate/guanylate cyclase domain-containing protein [Synechococcus elongatus]|uniref:Adenylate/guanylate cyclase domain-containing protein n=1 Tax=Synechococcus elongatus PCC 11802 TaxID=2283154 RepID=A0AAT9JZV0_SYNEL|nr:adenylate/guanylate cyclase domain-containing protein [Synechococcus elongatus]